MRSQQVIPYYSPRETFIHQVPNGLKLSLVVFYAVLLMICYQSLSVGVLLFLFVGTTLCLRFPIRGLFLAVCLLLALGYITFFLPNENPVISLVIAFAKIFGISLVFALFSRTTKLNTFLNTLSSTSGKIDVLRPIFYVINTILAIFPSIQYEFDKAVMAEGIRRGKPLRYYNLDSYLLILSVTLVRIINRSERFTDTVIERGLTPGTKFHLPEERSATSKTIISGLVLFIPGCLTIWLEFFIL
jgi:energy-coupling factor transporter transmembrane protein EcfT